MSIVCALYILLSALRAILSSLVLSLLSRRSCPGHMLVMVLWALLPIYLPATFSTCYFLHLYPPVRSFCRLPLLLWAWAVLLCPAWAQLSMSKQRSPINNTFIWHGAWTAATAAANIININNIFRRRLLYHIYHISFLISLLHYRRAPLLFPRTTTIPLSSIPSYHHLYHHHSSSVRSNNNESS